MIALNNLSNHKTIAQKRILEKTQFLQKINLGAENEQNVKITRYFNPTE